MSETKDKELLEACERGGKEDIERLIKEGTSVNCTGGFLKHTPLHNAAYYGHTSVISILISHGAELEAKDRYNRTPLHYAAEGGHASAISLLISHGAQLEAKDKYGVTPLHLAALYGHTSAISLLITHGSHIEAKNINGRTPLHRAAFKGKTSAISCLISYGAETEAKDNDGQTPLHMAALRGEPSAITCLISHGAETEAKDNAGQTPLHMAALRGEQSAISCLIFHGAETEAKDNDGLTPYDYAGKRGHRDICNLLKAVREYPRELQYLSVQDENNFTETLKSGQYDSHVGKLMCVGPEGVGKTAIVSVLRNVEPSKQRISTEGIDLHTYQAAINIEKMEWVSRELSAEDVAIRDLILEPKENAPNLNTEHDDEDFNYPEVGFDQAEKSSAVGSEKHFNKDDSVSDVPSHNDDGRDIDRQKTQHKELSAEDGATRDFLLEPKEDAPIFETGKNDEDVNYPKTGIPGYEHDRHSSAVGMEELSNKNQIGKDVLPNNDEGRGTDTDTNKKKNYRKPRKSPFTKLKQFLPFKRKESISIGELQEISRQKSMKGLLDRALAPVNMMDFGGQAAFYSTHQSFLTYRGLYILVIDGSRDFDDIIDTEDCIPGRHGKPTAREFTKFWVSSIQAYSKGGSKSFPKILVVCTHKDRVPKDEADQRADKIFLEIEKMFSGTPAEKHLILNPRIFLNAMDSTDPGYNTLKQVLVQQICSQPSWGEKLPKAWIPLKMVINQKVEEGKVIMSLDELKQINEENPVQMLSENELATFLKIHHAQGEIIHFPIKGLEDHIIISPKFLVDALKSLVTDKRFCEGRRMRILQRINQSGVLNRKDIEYIWKGKKRFVKHKQFLLSLFGHLDIIATPRHYDKDGKLQETDIYYVPSLVQGGNDTNYLGIDLKSRSIGLSLKFKSEILPPAIGYRFIASSIDVHEIRNYNGRDMLFSGMVVLGVNKKTDLLILLRSDRIDIYLVHETSKDQLAQLFASSTLECLQDMLESILESFRKISSEETCTVNVPFEIQFPCYNIVSTCYEKTRNSFTCMHGHTITMLEKEKWFTEKKVEFKLTSEEKANSLTGVPANDPTMVITDRQLANLCFLLTKEELDNLVIQLGLQRYEINAIEDDNPRSLMNIKFLCLHEWRGRFNGSIQNLREAAENQNICLEKIIQMNVDKPSPEGMTIIDGDPTDVILDLVAKQVISDSLLFCVYLGIDASFWIGLKGKRYKIVDINREVLFRWRIHSSAVNKMEDLTKALFRVDIDIETLLQVK